MLIILINIYFTAILRKEGATEFEEAIGIFLKKTTEDYPEVAKYLEKELLPNKNLWALCYRKDLILRGSHTNNIVECAFLCMKDSPLMKKMPQYCAAI